MTVTMKGNPLTLIGQPVEVGDPVPDFTLMNGDMQAVGPDDLIEHGKRNALLIVVPSLDTGVCSIESQKFNTRIGEFPADVDAYVVSRDLTFAQARWAKEQGDVKLRLLSDAREQSFGPAFGVGIKENGLLARSVFLIGKDRTLLYKQIVPELTHEPDYDDVIAAVSRASSAVNA